MYTGVMNPLENIIFLLVFAVIILSSFWRHRNRKVYYHENKSKESFRSSVNRLIKQGKVIGVLEEEYVKKVNIRIVELEKRTNEGIRQLEAYDESVGSKALWACVGLASGGLSTLIRAPMNVYNISMKRRACRKVQVLRFQLTDSVYSKRHCKGLYMPNKSLLLSESEYRNARQKIMDILKDAGEVGLEAEAFVEVWYENLLDIPYSTIRESIEDVCTTFELT
mmetsp:Transcript_4715/g.6209  ORF Transcript_4715/g.6209 Transcript_4715/m.6209 type:complete len:223 (+) Transcript_4715:105-773(+)